MREGKTSRAAEQTRWIHKKRSPSTLSTLQTRSFYLPPEFLCLSSRAVVLGVTKRCCPWGGRRGGGGVHAPSFSRPATKKSNAFFFSQREREKKSRHSPFAPTHPCFDASPGLLQACHPRKRALISRLPTLEELALLETAASESKSRRRKPQGNQSRWPQSDLWRPLPSPSRPPPLPSFAASTRIMTGDSTG